MNIEYMEITPQIASEMLQRNDGNRRINKARVNQYAADMVRGEFESLDPIAIAEDGQLLNGQHRLSAVISAGIPVRMLVIRDCKRTMVFDKGQARSSVDSLKMSGLISQAIFKYQMAAVNCYLDILIGHSNITDVVRADFINKYEYEVSLIKGIYNKGGKTHKYTATAAYLAGCLAALLSGVPYDVSDEFSDIVSSGFSNRPNQSAAIVLRNYLISLQRFGGAINRKTCAITQMAIRDYVAGYPRKKMYTNLEHCYIKNKKENEK